MLHIQLLGCFMVCSCQQRALLTLVPRQHLTKRLWLALYSKSHPWLQRNSTLRAPLDSLSTESSQIPLPAWLSPRIVSICDAPVERAVRPCLLPAHSLLHSTHEFKVNSEFPNVIKRNREPQDTCKVCTASHQDSNEAKAFPLAGEKSSAC